MKPIAELTDTELSAEHGKLRHETRKEKKLSTASIQSFDTINSEPIRWLWAGRIPLGKLSLLAGDPGLGKSMLSLDIAARISRGLPFPDGAPCEAGSVLLASTEDDPADTLRPRLDAAGADVSRVHVLHCGLSGTGAKLAPTFRDVEIFADAIDQVEAAGGRVRMIVLDPLDSYLSDETDGNAGKDVRKDLDPLAELAAARGFALLVVAHLNKSSDQSPVYRVGGALAKAAKARAVWGVVKDREDSGLRHFLPMKCNLSKDVGGYSFHIEEWQGAPRVAWDGPTEKDVRDLMGPERRERREAIAPEQDRVFELFTARAPEALRTKEIAELIGSSPSAISNILDKLRGRGLVHPAAVYGYWQLSSLTPTGMNAESDESRETVKGTEGEHSLHSRDSSPFGGGGSSESPFIDVVAEPVEEPRISMPELLEEVLDEKELEIW